VVGGWEDKVALKVGEGGVNKWYNSMYGKA